MNSLFLALETSGFLTGVALVADDSILFETAKETDARHNENLLLIIDEAFKSTGSSLDQLAGICLTIGPGMFTSLRVGLSTAKGLALFRQIPIKGVNTLQALAETATPFPDPVLALIDARKQELYAGLYQAKKPLLPPTVIAPHLLPKWLSQLSEFGFTPAGKHKTPLLLAGDGTKLAESFLSNSGIDFQTTHIKHPNAVVVARLGRELIQKEGPDNIQTLKPCYLRRTDAELKREGQRKEK